MFSSKPRTLAVAVTGHCGKLYMLAGDLRVEGYPMGPGDYCRADPLTIHGEIRTESGAVFLTLSSQRDERLASTAGA